MLLCWSPVTSSGDNTTNSSGRSLHHAAPGALAFPAALMLEVGSLPFPPLPSRAGQGVRGDLARKLRYKRCYRHSPQYSSAPAHLWCEGVVWVASVSVSVMQASVNSLSLGLLLLCARCWPQITTESEHLRHSAALPGECSSVECSVATPGSVLFILPTNTVTASHCQRCTDTCYLLHISTHRGNYKPVLEKMYTRSR